MFFMEIATASVGLLVGAWMKIKTQELKSLEAERLGRQQGIDDQQHARQWSVKFPQIQWTKRVLALTLVGTWCAMHLGISIPELLGLKSQVVVGYTEVVPKFLFFGEKEAVKWVTVEGSAITPAFNHVVILLMSYYFGSGGTQK